jgi:hypothetical protein
MVQGMMDQPQPGEAQGMGIDPALCEQLIAEASQLQADGQRKMSISEELFAQIQGAMQNFYTQKQQVQQEDIATAMNAQQLGALTGKTLFELGRGTVKNMIQERIRSARAYAKKPKKLARSSSPHAIARRQRRAANNAMWEQLGGKVGR